MQFFTLERGYPLYVLVLRQEGVYWKPLAKIRVKLDRPDDKLVIRKVNETVGDDRVVMEIGNAK